MSDLGRLYGYIGRFRGRVTSAVVFGVLGAVLNFASLGTLLAVFALLFPGPNDPTPWLRLAEGLPRWLGPVRGPLTRFLTEFVPGHQWQALVIVCVALLALALVRSASRFIQGYCSGYVAVHATRSLASDLYRKIVDQPVGFFNEARVSQTVSRITNDVAAVGQGLDVLFDEAIRQPLNFAVCLGFCLMLDWRLTLMSAVALPPVALAVVVLGGRARRASRRALERVGGIMGVLTESLTGIRIVKVFGGQSYEQGRFDRGYGQYSRQRMKVIRAQASIQSLVEFLTFAGAIACLLLAGRFILSGRLERPEVMAFAVALGAMIDPLRKLASVHNRMQQLRAGAERVFEYGDLAGESDRDASRPELPPLTDEIRYQDVSFSYDGKETVLEGISFGARRGEVVALVGHSGGGKTTLLGLLARFYEPTLGRITIDGTDIAGVSLRSLRSHMALVTQETVLFDDTVERNIAYGAGEIDRERVEAAAKAAHAHEFIVGLPRGYETVIGEAGSLLSGGQRQRLAIARALYKDPQVLVLDEATSSVDVESEMLIREALERLMRGRTVFVIAHRLATVERADRILVIEHGKIEAMGTHRELMERSPIYRELYAGQFSSNVRNRGEQ